MSLTSVVAGDSLSILGASSGRTLYRQPHPHGHEHVHRAHQGERRPTLREPRPRQHGRDGARRRRARRLGLEVDSSLLGSLGTKADLLVVSGNLDIASGALLSFSVTQVSNRCVTPLGLLSALRHQVMHMSDALLTMRFPVATQYAPIAGICPATGFAHNIAPPQSLRAVFDPISLGCYAAKPPRSSGGGEYRSQRSPNLGRRPDAATGVPLRHGLTAGGVTQGGLGHISKVGSAFTWNALGVADPA